MAEPEEEEWADLEAFAHRPAAVDRALLRVLLASTLRARGHDFLVAEDSIAGAETSEGRAPGVIAMLVLWGVGAGLAARLGLAWWAWPFSVIAVAVVAALLVQLIGERLSAIIAVALLFAWIAVGIAERDEGFGTLAATHLLPLTLAIAYGFASRSLRLRDAQDVALALGGVARAAPLLGPLVLVVLFLPALSNNLWQVADALNGRSFLAIGVLSVGLLLWVVRRQLGRELETVLRQRAAVLSDDQRRIELTRIQAANGLDENGRALLDGMPDDALDAAWPAGGEEYAPYLTAAESATLARPLTARLLVTVGAVGLLLCGYVYLLCSAVVPANIAGQWTSRVVHTATADVFGMAIHLHGGPYLKVAALLGTAATATFLSFAVVEERFAAALTDALLRDPADRFLAVALPYLALCEAELAPTDVEEAQDDEAPS